MEGGDAIEIGIFRFASIEKRRRRGGEDDTYSRCKKVDGFDLMALMIDRTGVIRLSLRTNGYGNGSNSLFSRIQIAFPIISNFSDFGSQISIYSEAEGVPIRSDRKIN